MTPRLSVPWSALASAEAPSAGTWVLVGAAIVTLGLVGLAVRRWRRQRQRAYVWADALIRAPRPIHTAADETLPRLARDRRDRADRYRRAAVRVETGHPASVPAHDRVVAMAGRRSL